MLLVIVISLLLLLLQLMVHSTANVIATAVRLQASGRELRRNAKTQTADRMTTTGIGASAIRRRVGIRVVVVVMVKHRLR